MSDAPDLSFFSLLAHQPSLAAAAQALGVTPPAVSRRLAALEQRLGVRLLHRTTRRVGLTEAGQKLLQRISPALKELDAAMDALRQHGDRPAGLLRLTVPDVVAIALLDPLLGEFMARWPDVRLDIHVPNGLSDLIAEGCDAGIRLGERLQRDMVAVPVSPDLRMVVVGSPAYLAAHGVPQSPADLSGHQAVRMRLSHGGLHPWELERHGETLTVDVPGRLLLDDPQLMRNAARAGMGLAFLSEWHIREELARGELIPVLQDWCPPFPGLRLYYPGHRHVPAGLRALIDLIHFAINRVY
jgi:DNA-binding transcriptional LysR family regulator